MVYTLRPLIPLLILCCSLMPALAQGLQPVVPRDLVNNRRPVEGDTITFCVNPQSLANNFNRAVAQAIAQSLLAKAEFHNVTPNGKVQPLDYSFPISDSELFIYLSEYCQAFVGFNLSSNVYPEWLTFSRIYAETRFVLAVTNPDYQSLKDIPVDKAIGTRFVSAADLKLVNYLQSLPVEQQWKKFGFFSNQILVDKLLDGTVGAALIWEPSLAPALKGKAQADQVRVISTDDYSPPLIQFGLALRSKDTALRTLLDQAIVSLIEDGTIDRLLEEYQVPGEPGSLKASTAEGGLAPWWIAVGGAVLLLGVAGVLQRVRRRPRKG
jgi:polar amino acid transport system substrate-binding protein